MKPLQIWSSLSLVAILVSACSGVAEQEPGNDASPGSGGEIGSGGATGDDGTTGSGGVTASGGVTGSGGVTTIGSSSVHTADAGMSGLRGGSMGAGGAMAIGGATSAGTGTTPPSVDTSHTPSLTTATATTSTTSTTAMDARPPTPTAQLTAGTWDDNLNFSFYSTYLANTATAQLSGMPVIARADRMVILVMSADNQPVAGAQVSVADGQGHLWGSITGAEGRVIYFPAWASVTTGATLTITATVANLSVSTTTAAAAGTVVLDIAQTALPTVTALDLAFVIDTTGSMGDELSYVQSELDGIVGGIATQFPGIAQRWALVLYRDTGDEYVVRSIDFTSELSSFRANLAAQSAAGGGDTPEAVDQALAAATRLGWHDGPTARMVFWIADAPHHVGLENKVVAALGEAVSKAIHIYPVAASGIDDLGEFTMRTAAEVTGGRYLFLTNDSGIGGGHAEPHIPCYYVTVLASAMRRMVATEVMGINMPPAPADILRTGGDPQNQQCLLSSGEAVTVW